MSCPTYLESPEPAPGKVKSVNSGCRVRLSEISLMGLPHWRIETESCTWYFDPAGGGFSRLADRDGLDWIGFEPGPPPHSYRGIPNIQTFVAGKFSGIFHPGYTSVSSRVLEAGPGSVIIESRSTGEGPDISGGSGASESQWVCRWEISADKAVCTVLQGLPCGFAFLYEGTPGGGPFDGSRDYMRLPSGEKLHFSRGAKDKLFIPPGEAPDTVRFGRDGLERELEFSFAGADGSRAGIGQYSVYEALTVFGFGREEEPGIRSYPAVFTLLFIETPSAAAPAGGDSALGSDPDTAPASAPAPAVSPSRSERCCIVSCSLDGISLLRIAGRPSAFFPVYGRLWRKGMMTAPQEGNAAEGESAFSRGLAWSLNGSPLRRLALGPDSARLVGPGDFVADIPWNELQPGSNELSFFLMEDDEAGQGSASASESAGTWSAGPSSAGEPEDSPSSVPRGSPLARYFFCTELQPFPELPVLYDFESVPHPRIPGAAVLDALPVDGEWIRNPEGIAPARMGYDRLLAFGDLSLREYRLRAEITLRGFAVDAPGYPQSMGPGVGFLLGWSGHHPDGLSPFREWRPIGALGWYRYGRDKVDTVRDFRLQLLGGRMKPDTQSEAIAEDCSGMKLETGVRYIFLLEADGRHTTPAEYRLKVWRAGQSEPAGWNISGSGLPGEAESGSALFVLHHADAILHSLMLESLSGTIRSRDSFNLARNGTHTG